MKNKTFIISAGVCLGAALIAETTILIVPVARVWGSAWFTALSNLSRSAEMSLMPVVAAGLVVLLALGHLRLWQCSSLGLSMVVFYALIRTLVSPLVEIMSGDAVSYSASFHGIAFAFQEAGMYYLFPILIGALAFYGFACKKRIVALLCTAWSVCNWLLLHLLPPFFQKFDGANLSMDGRSATRIRIYIGLFVSATVLLIYFIIADLYSQKRHVE